MKSEVYDTNIIFIYRNSSSLTIPNAELFRLAGAFHTSATITRRPANNITDKTKNFQYLMESISLVQNNNNLLKMPK